MKNLYIKAIESKIQYLVVLLVFLLGTTIKTNAQVRVNFAQRTSQYTPSKKIYNVKGDFTMLGNTCLTPQNYGDNTNNNGQYMTYVDTDGDPNTFNSSSATLALSTENGAIPSCSNIVYAGLYWTGKSSSNNTFNVTRQVPNGTESINNNLTATHNQNITNTNYSLSITRNNPNPSGTNTSPVFTFSGNGNTYVFSYTNNAAPAKVTLSVNGGTAVNVPVTIVTSGSTATATLTTPYTIVDGTVTIKINSLVRSTAINLSTTDTRNSSSALVNVSGTIQSFTTITKNYDKRVISLKGPNSSSYTKFTASASDIYYPTGGADDNIFSAYKEITDYVRTNGIGEYFAADMALLEGNVSGTGYSGGWGIIVVYENAKMKYRDVTIFDGYAYVQASNSSGFTLPVSGFNTVQAGNVGVKLGLMASEGDVAFTGDYFQIQKNSDASYLNLSHSGNSSTNFFNSSINTGGAFRNPSLQNNTGIDISMFNVPNPSNSVIGNNQTSTNFKYGTSGDTYSIFAIAMAVDAYIPEVEGVISATSINNVPVTSQPYTSLPGQEIALNIDVKNLGTEAINNYKLIVPIPYNATYVTGSAVGTVLFSPLPTPNNVYFDASLGATGSIVWDFGKLPLPVNPSTLLGKLSFKIKATLDCQILSNSSCGSKIVIDGTSSGVGATTGITFSGTKVIQGYTQNGTCIGQPISESINVGINGADYVATNCQNAPLVRNFSYCNGTNVVSPTEISSNFPVGTLFYDSFPVTMNSIQYTVNNPFPLTDGSSITYFAVPPGNSGCNFPFTIAKCKKIIANDDTGTSINGLIGGTSFSNVLVNDTLNGILVTPSQVSLSFVSSTNPGVKLNGSNVVVDPGTPEGSYTLTYQICEVGNLTNCDTAIVTVTVTKSVIIAQDDIIAGGNGLNGNTNAGNVLSNNGNGADTLNGNPVAINQVNLTVTTPAAPINGGFVPVIDVTTGQISIPAGTPAGNYTIDYQICEKLNPTNCDPAIVYITVSAPAIIAQDDIIAGGNGLNGNTNAGNVLSNNGNGADTLNGNPVAINQVNLTVTTPATPINGGFVPVIDVTTGQISIPAGTPAGNYTIDYQICEKLNPTNCDPAIVYITVSAPAIIAQDDIIAGGNGLNGNTNAGNVLSNNGNGADTLNGNPVAINQVNLTVTTPATPINGGFVPVIDVTTGQISIPAGTPAGNYTIDYQICEKLNPTNCDPAIVYITVSAPAIIAQDDIIAGGNGLNGNTNAGNVLSNNGNDADTLNGNPVAINQVNLTVTTPAAPINGGSVPSIDITTGQISIPAGTPAGNYTIVYQICEKLNPSNCDPATVYITVTAPAIIAQDDIIAGGNGLNGNTNAGNVLSNNGNGADTLNGNPVAINQVNLTVTTPAAPINGGSVPVIDVTTGQISIPAGTPAGNYTIVYQICEKLNPSNCDPATVYITVTAPAIIAQDDIIAGGNGLNGNSNAGNVLSNNGNGADTLNGNTVAINQVNLTVTTPAASINGGSVPVIDVTTGQISIPAGTPAGNYTIVYQICEKLNPSNCDPATVYIIVSAPAIAAVDNDFSIECSSSSILGNVLQNDLLNGLAFSSDKVNISLISGGNANINLDTTTGDISVINSGLTVGQYTLEYTICEKLNPTNCSTANITITVNDLTAPIIPTLADVKGECSATVIAPTTSDNCAGTITATTSDPLLYTTQGTYVVNWTFDDGNGNIVTTTQNVIVDNTTKPVLPILTDVIGQCSATVTAPTFNNVCSDAIITATTNDPLTYTSQGTFVVTWTFDDGDGNVQTATQNVIVKDTIAPAAPVLADVTAECSTSVTAPTAQDNCAGIITATTNNPLSYNSQGTFVITWTFNDGNGNSSSSTQNVIIQNTTPPPAVACYETATFNPTTCAYDITGTQPEAPVVACYETATFNPTTCAYDITGTQPEAPVVACYETATFNPTTCAYDITGTQPEAPVVACYQTATFNPKTCAYDITGTQPEAPVVACYQTATFNPTTCAYDITGTQPEAPVVACYQTATFNPTTCAYDITGTQPEAPVVACYETATFNPTTCAYDITGTQPEAPIVACYETATFNPTTCAYDITGTQPEAPVVACYETATFNPTTCAYDITGTQPEAPVVACYQTATFNPTTCAYDITGTQPEAPVVACYQTATFNPTTCAYDITGTQPEAPVVACYETATFNPTTCAYDITGTQPEAPVVACYETATFNPTTCAYDITGTQPEAPVVACYETATFNPTTCAYDITGTQPEAPVVACYQTATFNPTTCAYDITGTQPEAPVVACYETATFNPTTCAYDITGTQPEAPVVACYETATFNPTTCAYDITGTQPEAPVVACYQTATFNPTTCAYDITGTQPEAPVVACYETATFNPTTCAYDITGTQPEAPVVACYETATFNPTTCAYDITGTQPEAPVVACYETATFNPTTCAYDITGTQPEAPVVACYETATFNPTTCAYDITGTQPEAPVVACYETATFNPTTCAYDITGTQPEAPVVACYETATFNPTTCAYDITGTQPEAPVVACYETATFNPTTCAYDITGTQPEAPVVACYETATFNPTTCAYDITGTQPEAPVVACYQTATFNPTTCAYDITGTQPEAPVVACYETATFNPTTCAYDITGTQPEAPVVACYQTATFNPTTCAYDITGTQPEAPVVACYQTATFNPTTCAYDITGTQPEAPVVACYQTATFNPTTCAYDITGTQPEAPVVACYETATFNPTTCAYDITGTQPEAPVVACYQTATFNPTTCAYDITGTQPEAPVVACYQTATFNPTTCVYDITGTQPEAPVVACYETATFNPTTCAYDITGTKPEAPVVACYQTATFNPTTCAYDITGTQPEAPVVACYQTATFNPTTCVYDITGTQPEAPVVACYETATFNPTTCAYDITGTKPEAPVVACYQTATFNPTTCAYDITGTQPEIPALADITGQCSVTAPKPTYTIACSGTEIVATTNDPLTYTTQGSYVINWKFDDGKGFVQAVSQNVIVKDTEKPVVPQLEDVIGQCTATATVPSALDNCSGNIKGTTNDPLSYSIKGDYVITWTFEDGNGNISVATQNVIVKDNEAPVAPTAPKNETYACLGDVPVAATLTAVDNCDGEINVKGEDAIVQGKCANSFVITRTWTFKDSSGNSSETITQTITVEDNLAPVFNELPATSTISCPAKPEFAEATAIDNCGGAFTLTFEDVTTPGTNGSYSVTRTWKAIDSCGNSSTATQTINVEDKTAPVPPVLEDVKGQCSATATAPIAVDSCVGNIVGTTSDPLTYSTQGTFVIRWTFNDGNGNSFTANQNVIVDDTRAPLAPELADITSQCSATATPPTANDGCAGAIVGTTTDPLKYTLEGTYVIRWTFDDGNGNVTSANQNVVVTSLTDEIGTDGYAKCNADVDLRVDLKALLPQGTPEGGTWTDAVNPNAIQGNIYIPNGINKGLYDLKYVVADGDCSKTVKVKMNVDDDCIVLPECSPIRVYNAVTPNDDGANDFFKIENIEFTDCFPTNKVEIYNRWGVLVFEVNQYDNNSRVFKGISEGRATVNKSSELPTGTYFYIIEYTNDKGDTLKKDGYLYLTR